MGERVSQEVVEGLYLPSGRQARVSHEVVNVLYLPSNRAARVSHALTEVLYLEGPGGGGGARFSVIWID